MSFFVSWGFREWECFSAAVNNTGYWDRGDGITFSCTRVGLIYNLGNCTISQYVPLATCPLCYRMRVAKLKVFHFGLNTELIHIVMRKDKESVITVSWSSPGNEDFCQEQLWETALFLATGHNLELLYVLPHLDSKSWRWRSTRVWCTQCRIRIKRGEKTALLKTPVSYNNWVKKQQFFKSLKSAFC